MRARNHDDDALQRCLVLARGGEQDGYTAVYRCLAGRVAGYVRGRGVDDVDEVVNDVFLAAFSNLSTGPADAAGFRSWLFTIAHNKAVDWHRARRRRPVTVELGERPIMGGDVDAEALASLGSANVAVLLALLSDDQCNVLLLRVVADLSLAETAEVLGKPIGAVKSLQHRALAALARAMSNEAVSPNATGATTESR